MVVSWDGAGWSRWAPCARGSIIRRWGPIPCRGAERGVLVVGEPNEAKSHGVPWRRYLPQGCCSLKESFARKSLFCDLKRAIRIR